MEVDFPEPRSPREAREKIAQLQDEVKVIEYQLSDPNKTDRHGERLSNTKYHKWRRGALKAYHAKVQELRFVRRWLHTHLLEIKARGVEVETLDCETLLLGAHNLLQQLRQRDVELTIAEGALIDIIRDYVAGAGP